MFRIIHGRHNTKLSIEPKSVVFMTQIGDKLQNDGSMSYITRITLRMPDRSLDRVDSTDSIEMLTEMINNDINTDRA